MSNFTAIATQTVESTRYVGLEHGTKRITLTIGDTGKQLGPLADHELTPAEARELAADLLARADELDPENAPLDVEFDPPPAGPSVEQLAEQVEQLDARLDAIAERLEAIVCTEGEDRGVILLSHDAPTHAEEFDGRKIQVYDLDCFSPLGEALVALHSLARGEGSDSK